MGRPIAAGLEAAAAKAEDAARSDFIAGSSFASVRRDIDC